MFDIHKILAEGGGFNFRYSRLRSSIYELGITSQTRLVATTYLFGQKQDPLFLSRYRPYDPCVARQAKLNHAYVVLPQGEFLRHTIEGGEMPEVWAFIKPGSISQSSGERKISAAGINHLDFVSVSLQFLRYHEAYKSHIGAAFRFAWDTIPDVWRFAGVIRNAIAHSGKITIDNPNFQTVEWMGLTYDHSSNGRDVEADLNEADLLILLFHMDAVLMDYEQGPLQPLPEMPEIQIPRYLIDK